MSCCWPYLIIKEPYPWSKVKHLGHRCKVVVWTQGVAKVRCECGNTLYVKRADIRKIKPGER